MTNKYLLFEVKDSGEIGHCLAYFAAADKTLFLEMLRAICLDLVVDDENIRLKGVDSSGDILNVITTKIYQESEFIGILEENLFDFISIKDIDIDEAVDTILLFIKNSIINSPSLIHNYLFNAEIDVRIVKDEFTDMVLDVYILYNSRKY